MLFQFSVGRILESDITSIVFNRKVRIAATPIMRINTLFDITVKRRKPPIGNLSYIAMFDRIEMQIIKMAGKIGLTANSMFPKAFCQSLRLPPIKYWLCRLICRQRSE
ncbi:Uncharacterised protein [Neisseria gonorrhoeae]|nr:hypothetical protein WX61_01905 [Neisseria gonorrhoeae]CNP18302.1 Uncharacterised protein [Neisseria gonorrhoeae]CNS01257.1 Uncharacterised protein [Neisseria gonorrhoeae]CNS12142.1 Uncharacterised protein [Neisseria gonorrhoeae]CNS24687.1 Uncharacterised protein [Neisseria gonorrhoeae]